MKKIVIIIGIIALLFGFNCTDGPGGGNLEPAEAVVLSDSIKIMPGGNYDFGSVKISRPIKIQFSIENRKPGDLVLSGEPLVDIEGSDVFIVVSQPNTPIPQNRQTFFSITCSPTTIGDFTATVSIASNDPGNSIYSFTITAAGIPNPPNPRFVPEELTVAESSEFTTKIFIDSGNRKVASYGFILTFDETIIKLDTETGSNGVTVGVDGYLTVVSVGTVDVDNTYIAFDPENPNPVDALQITGFDTTGVGPGEELHFLTIHWEAISPGEAVIEMTIKALTDLDYTDLSVGNTPGTATITVE